MFVAKFGVSHIGKDGKIGTGLAVAGRLSPLFLLSVYFIFLLRDTFLISELLNVSLLLHAILTRVDKAF